VYLAHITPALVARPSVPKASLGVLLLASLAIDVLSGVLGIFGVEYTGEVPFYPWSHGLLMAGVFTVVIIIIALIVSRDLRTSAVIGAVYFSHWILDFISHPMGFGTPMEPDLPLAFGNSTRIGLGLYNYVIPALVTEFGLFAFGIIYYLTRTRALDRTGKWAFWTVPALLVVGITPMAISSDLAFVSTLFGLLLLPLGIWIDRHRTHQIGQEVP